MERLFFEEKIQATPHQVWKTLWDDATYRKWTAVYSPGSHAVSDWREGSRIHFIGPEGTGMYSDIETLLPEKTMKFRHLGEMKNFKELDPVEGESWSGAIEQYDLEELEDGTLLKLMLDTTNDFAGYFREKCPQALARLRSLTETGGSGKITVSSKLANTSPEAAWKTLTTPENIKEWNAANDEWHCPESHADLKPGGKFSHTMAAKDGSASFDFAGTYTIVDPPSRLAYTLDDGRTVIVDLVKEEDDVFIVQQFEVEDTAPVAMQQAGWQAILDNFARHAEKAKE